MQQVICDHILKWVEDNLTSELNVSDMAASTGYNRRTLELWFSAQFGMSPGKYLYSRRMTRAAVLLKMTRLPITEIALLLHYSSNQNFARSFRRFFGISPTDCRKNKNWNLSGLQASLYHSKETILDVTVCILPVRYLQGQSCTCEDSYLYNMNKLLTDYIKQEVIDLTKSGAQDIYLSGNFLISHNIKDSRGGNIVSTVTVGKLVNNIEENTIIMPGGKFCRYFFSCKWEEYSNYTNKSFIRLISENNLFYSGDDCYVHFTGTQENIENQINCEVFIPIS
ncbi:helix-turn-helix transcriptional regulator [Citrobacter portucalensis]|uniref:helix-turn-helix transcriptional regulator n=1 Tax=Citrobacter portucalensis TaxID=1639133 RepID=UPI00288953DA|nr:AraC family transcriptional regulator [Citrobacter portucalensis]WNI84222.1 AraC family transcriptional regulator [Citrobacter portucalensis]